MTTVDINEQKFDAIARTVRKQLIGAKSKSGKAFGLSKSRQLVAQSIFGKAYEEVKETIFIEDTGITKVLLLEYGQEQILTMNGDYVICTATGTDLQISYKKIAAQASELAAKNDVKCEVIRIPQILNSEEWGYEGVIDLAKKMGYFAYKNTIFDLIEMVDTVTIINGDYCHDTLNGDWMGEIENEAYEYFEQLHENEGVMNENDLDHTIWMPELNNGFELYVSFRELCNASITGDPKVWILNSGNKLLFVSFKN